MTLQIRKYGEIDYGGRREKDAKFAVLLQTVKHELVFCDLMPR